MRALVVGGGIGGLTAAICLLDRGIDVRILERASSISEVGAGLQLSPNGVKVLAKLGMLEAIEKSAFRPKALDMRDGRSGKVTFSTPLAADGQPYGAPYFHIHRADLIEILMEALHARSPNALTTSAIASGYVQDETGIRLQLETGPDLTSDILIGADGIHSVVRETMLGADQARFTGNVAWRAVVHATEGLRKLVPPTASAWTGAGRHAVTYYLRRGELINFVGVVEQDGWTEESWKTTGSPVLLQEAFADFCEPVRAVTESIESCFRWALHDRMPLSRWTDGRATLLGDAAHPMLPFMAQGAVMAIEDAAVLAGLIAANPSSPSSALQAYEAARLPRTARMQAVGRRNARIFHAGGAFGRHFIQTPLRIAAGIAPALVSSQQDWIYNYDANSTLNNVNAKS